MESKRTSMLVTMIMMVMVMGDLLVQTEAQEINPITECYPACLMMCKSESKFPKYLTCPFTCAKSCFAPSPPESSSSNKVDDLDYFCKLGCATHHCVSLSSVQSMNVERVSSCLESCSNKCTTKN